MSISDDGIPLGTPLFNGGEGDATTSSFDAFAQELTPEGEVVPLTSRFVIAEEPLEPVLFPVPVFNLNPVIEDIQPRSGAPGTPVIILGRNFVPFEGTVRFNGVISSYNAATTTRIDTVVPNFATTGPVSVDGFNSPFDFVVLAPSTAPTITGFSPTGGRPGDVVTLGGTSLDRVTEARFNGVRADGIALITPQILQATVPFGATTGPITVSGPSGSATSPGNFVVGTGFPTITSFAPTAGTTGTPVDIFGTELGGAFRVTFNGQDAQFSVISNTQVRAFVPGFVGVGPIRVHTPLGIATSTQNFTAGAVLPAITSFSPTTGRVNDIVTINGTSLDQATGVRIGAFRIPAISRPSNQQITFTVPPGATTGNIILESNAGEVVGGVFTVLAPAPTVTGLQPASGFTGLVVFISGTGLNQVTGASFTPGISVPVNLLPDGRLAVTVPTGAQTGPITLFFPGGSVQTPVFTVITDNAPSVIVLSPSTGQTFNTGQAINVQWSASDDGTIVSQEIRYSADGGPTMQILAANLAGDVRSRTVTLPGTPTDNAVIFVRATDNGGRTGEGRSATFRVLAAPVDRPPTVTVLAPNGGETLTVGQAFTISWNSGDDVGLAAHDVAVSYDGGASWESLVGGIPGFRRNLQFTPTRASAAALVSVTAVDTAGQRTTDRSDAPFRILPADRAPLVTVLSPNGGEAFVVGQNVTVTWSAADDVGILSQEVRVSYDGGANWESVAQNLGPAERRAVFIARTTSDQALVAVRVTDTAQQTTVDRSDAFFRIVSAPPTVRVITPNGGETFQVGQPFTISWESTGDLAKHDVLISYDGGANWEDVARGIPAFRRNAMFTPTRPSENALVQVIATDTSGRIGEDRSDAPFRIVPADARPMVTVLSPNGGETFTVGQPIPVTWTASDDVGIVSQEVLVSYDGGATVEVALPNLPPDVRSAGFIATRASEQAFVRVRVTDTAQQTGMDRSDAFFRVVAPPPRDNPPMVTVLSPNGGETFTVGQPFPISWISSDDQGIAFHDVRISYDGGLNFEPVVTNIPGFRQNAMCTPRIASDTALVAVAATDFAGQRTEDLSDGFFRILPADTRPMVTVLSPNGGETFTVGQPIPVSWTASDDVGIVSQEVLVSYDGGATVEVVLPNLPPDVRSAGFIATRASDQVFVRVRVTDTAQQTGMDRSDAFFRVVAPPPRDNPPMVTVLSPNGGETFIVGQPFPIRWISSDDQGIAFHDVRISYDGGMNFEPVVTGIPGFRQSAMCTPRLASETALVAVAATDFAGQRTEDVSDGFFRILPPPADQPPTVTVLAPNGGEQLIPGQTVTVSWTAADDREIAFQDVRFSTDGGGTFKPIAERIPGFRRQAQWVVPNEPTGFGLVSVTATDNAGQSTEDRSDNFFTIIGLLDLRPRVRVLSPNGGELFLVGQTVTVSWESSDDRGLVSHDVEFSTDGGATWQPIALDIPGFRRNAQWTIPDQPTDRALVRVTATDTAGQKGEDVSDAFFRIIRFGNNTQVTVLSPNGGEQLQAGQTVTVSWSLAGDTPISQDVRFSTDGGATFSRVASALPGTARSVTWMVPGVQTTMGLIEVVTRDAAGTVTARDRSDAFFSIGAQPRLAVTVLAPNGGEVFTPGQVTTVSWKVSGDIGLQAQRVQASFDGGASWETIAPSLPGFMRSFAWTVPDRPTTQGLISVSFFDPLGRLVEDRGDGFFTITTLVRTPRVDSVFPSQGPVSGGTPVTIQGRNFDARARVRIGGIDAVTFPVSSTMVNAITPRALFAGFVNVAVINPDGARGVLENGFRYVLQGAGDPTSGQIVFQSATVADPVPDPDAGLPEEDAFEDGAALTLEAGPTFLGLPEGSGDTPLADAQALSLNGDDAGSADAGSADADSADALAVIAEPADALTVIGQPVEGEAEISRPLGRSALIPQDVEPLPGMLPGTEVIAAAAGTPEVIEVRAGETVSVALFAELFDAQGQPVRDRLLDILSGGNPPKSTLSVQPNPALSFSTFIATLATTIDTPAGEYLLLFAGQTLTAPFLRTPDLGVRIRVLPARRRVRVFVAPPRQAGAPGETVTFQVSLRRRNLPGIPVRLKVKNALPAGVAVTFDPPRTFTDTATMKVALPAGMAAGEFPIEVTAKVNVVMATAIPADPVIVEVKPAATPATSRLDSGEATVTDPEPDEGPIEPAAATGIIVVPAGGTVAFPVTAFLFDGFGNPVADDVDFTIRGVPPGAVGTIVPDPGRTFVPSVASVVTTRLTPVGRYVLEISGESLNFPGITYGPIQVPLEVKPRIRRVEITAETVESRVTAGQTAEYQLTLSRTGFRDRPVQLLVDPATLPAGATASFEPAAPTGNAAVLKIATTAATPAGTYTVSIGGKTEVEGVEIRGTTVKLIVDAAPVARTVKLAVTPTSVALRPGGQARFAVKLNRTNAADVQVALRAQGNLPAGTVFAFTPTRTITSSSTLVVTLPADARPGAYTFTVTGTTTVAGVMIEPSTPIAVKVDPPLA